jgi:predicted dehydrogenase
LNDDPRPLQLSKRVPVAKLERRSCSDRSRYDFPVVTFQGAEQMGLSNRRNFLEAGAGAGSLLLMGTRASGNIRGANDKLRIAVAGLNGRGQSHLSGWLDQPNVELAWVIDPDQKVLANAMNSLQSKLGDNFRAKGVADVREALEDKTLDAISVATPNHWHSLITIWAAQAGKHVYVEKPMSHDVGEGRICRGSSAEIRRRHLQHGTQNRSNAQIAGLHEAIQAGKVWQAENLLRILLQSSRQYRPQADFRSTGQPRLEPLRGPAVIDEFHGNLVHYNWHWFWKSGNGDLNNQGTHQLDIARWALDTKLTHPTPYGGDWRPVFVE